MSLLYVQLIINCRCANALPSHIYGPFKKKGYLIFMSPLPFYFAVQNKCDPIVFFPAVHDHVRIYSLFGHDLLGNHYILLYSLLRTS